MSDDATARSRWRLVLGRYAEPRLPDALDAEGRRQAGALDRLYDREYTSRGVRHDPKLGPPELAPGSLDPSQLSVPDWLNEVRELFPRETCETVTRHALDRYGLTELIEDPDVLASLEPSTELLASVLQLKGRLSGRVLEEARRLVRRVVEDLRKRIEQEVRAALSGRADRFRRSRLRVARNFDARTTIRRNLKNWDPDRRKIVVSDPWFFRRVRRHLPWDVVVCVDQSGSMASSVIHSAVVAAVLASLPAVRVRLVVFDTSVVDLTDHVSDPVEVLMSVQLGGGTNIGAALRYCETLVVQPRRTVLVLVTDFCEGADPRVMIAACRRLHGAGVRLIGLAALDAAARPFYDASTAERMAAEGMEIAALTPKELAAWLGGVLGSGT